MRYGIIGGGVLGLTTALRLAQRGHDVEVLERDVVPGGLAAGFEIDRGIWLERYYHHLFQSDRSAIRLIDEVGLASALEWHRPVTTVFRDGRIRQLDSPLSLLRFDGLPFASRLRTAMALAIVKLVPTPRLLGRFTAAHWMATVGGRAGYDAVWEPLLRAKFGDRAEDIAMAWLWARLHDRTSSLGYVRGGFHQFYRALADAITAARGTVTLEAAVANVRRDDAGGFEIEGSGPAGPWSRHYDQVVATVPPAVLRRIAPSLADELVVPPATESLSAQCLILELDRSLTDVYWIGVAEAGWPYLAVVEHTRMIDPSQYGGRTLLYLGAYRPPDDPILRMDEAAQIELAGPLLRAIDPAFDPAWIRRSWSFVAPFAQPIVDLDFESRIPGFESGVSGLHLATMFQVYPHDRGQNYSIELAERLVRYLEGERD